MSLPYISPFPQYKLELVLALLYNMDVVLMIVYLYMKAPHCCYNTDLSNTLYSWFMPKGIMNIWSTFLIVFDAQ